MDYWLLHEEASALPPGLTINKEPPMSKVASELSGLRRQRRR
jgi:hypothetical protein